MLVTATWHPMVASFFPHPENHVAEVVIWRWQDYAIGIHVHGLAIAKTLSMQSVGENKLLKRFQCEALVVKTIVSIVLWFQK